MSQECVEEILTLLRERPNDVELHQRLGSAHFHRRQFPEALNAYRQAIRLVPDDAFSYLYLGNLLELFDKEDARACYERAAELMPNESVAFWCRGHLSRAEGRFADADEAYQKAVAVDPGNEQAQQILTEWREFIGGLRGGRGVPFYLRLKTHPGKLVDDARAQELLTEAKTLAGIETLYFDRHLGDADVEADVLADELAEGTVTSDDYAAFCCSQQLRALDDAGQVVPESAQRFNWMRWGQDVVSAVLPNTELAASDSFNKLVAFARTHGLEIHTLWPSAAIVDLENPDRLPPGWYEIMSAAADK